MQDRFVPGSVRKIQESLQWLGLDFDEGPSVGGDHGPYMQVSHMPIKVLVYSFVFGWNICS